MADIVTRFAPSPTGYLHLGHAYSALEAWRFSQENSGRFILRIEDIDGSRCRPAYEAALKEDLAWLGISWEEPVRRQSEHMNDYKSALERLQEKGVLYPCFCTRKEIAAEVAQSVNAPHGPDGALYPGSCCSLTLDAQEMRIADGVPYALRLNMRKALQAVSGSLEWEDMQQGTIKADPGIFGDVILARKETPTSYHLSVTWDDALQGVTHVVRGEDLLFSTHIHRLLQALLDLPVPVYRHHKLITDKTGKRLSKRDRAISIRSLREAGKSPADIFKQLGY